MTQTDTMNKQYWIQMGVELEGGWEESPITVAQKCIDAKFKTDTSVKVRSKQGHSGEIITRPHRILDNLCKDIEVLYPTHTDYTCGYHIHTSFDPLNTSFLTSQSFWKFFQEYWEVWGKENKDGMTRTDWGNYIHRLEGRRFEGSERNYCEKKFIPDDQLINHQNRYTQVNFVSYSKHRTVEIRFLPMFSNVELAIKATRDMAVMYNRFLNDFKFDPITIKKDIQQKDNIFIEEYRTKQPSLKETTEEFKASLKRKIPVIPEGEVLFYAIDGAQDLMLPWTKKVPGHSL